MLGLSSLSFVIINRVFHSLKCKDDIVKDMIAVGGNNTSKSLQKTLREVRTFRSIFLYRVYHESKIKYHLIRHFFKTMDSLELNVTSGKIGAGFAIWHGYGTVIFCKEIGKECTFYQGVTLGRGKTINGCDIPTIGDHVEIFTNAVVIGGIHIGNNVKIGAGTVVTKDVPDNCTVVGAPMRIIHNND